MRQLTSVEPQSRTLISYHSLTPLSSLILEDILIYDEHADALKVIDFETAIKFSCIEELKVPDGANADSFDEWKRALGLDRVSGGTAKSNEEASAKTAGKTAAAYDTNKAKCVASLIANVANGIWVPIKLVIARPFIEHRLLSAVMVKSGPETGATLFGPAGKQNIIGSNLPPLDTHSSLPFGTFCWMTRNPSLCSQTCKSRYAFPFEP